MPAKRFVLDASVAVEWFLPSGGPGGRYAEGILERIGGEELVPAVPDRLALRARQRPDCGEARQTDLGCETSGIAACDSGTQTRDTGNRDRRGSAHRPQPTLPSSRVRRGLFRTCA